MFWALRGAGGGQFGVVTSLLFDTVPEPLTTRIEARWSSVALEDLVAAWQAWAPDAPDELTVNLTLESEPGAPARAAMFGASTLEERSTRELLREFTDRAFELHASLPYHRLKQTFAEPDPPGLPEPAVRTRSEFFSHGLSHHTLASLLSQFNAARTEGRRQLTFTAMGGAYNRVAEDASAFAHRGEHFLLEHIGDPADPWIDRSWATAHADGSGRSTPTSPTPPLTIGPRRTTRATTAGWWRQESLRPAPVLRLPPSHLRNSEGET